jgi:hypothetical protein
MNRYKETAKTILIFLLIISGTFMALMTWIYDTSVIPAPLYKAAADFLSRIGIDVPAAALIRPETNPSGDLEPAARPIRCAVTFGTGRYGAEYDQTAVDMVLNKTLRYVGLGIGTAQAPAEVTRDDWHSALLREGFYFEYLGGTPLSAIALWENYEPRAFLDASVRKVALSVEDGGVALYFKNEENGKYYRSMTSVDKKEITDQIEDYSGNSNCTFAFEKGGIYPDSMDELFLFDERPFLRAAVVETATVEDGMFNALKNAFGMSPGTKRVVQENDGTVFAVEGSKSLILSAGGIAEYRNSSTDIQSDDVIYISADGSNEADVIEKVRSIAVSAAGKVINEAKLYLKDIDYNKTSRRYTVNFGYVLNGVPVLLSDSANAATFRIEGGVLTYARISLRKFTLEDGKIRPMPAETAAALAGGASELGLFYKEEHGSRAGELTVGWYGKSDASDKVVR